MRVWGKRGGSFINECEASSPLVYRSIVTGEPYQIKALITLNSNPMVTQANTKLVYAETPANPILRISDISALAELAHQAGAVLAIDSTWASPALQKPLALGADYVIHSLTKFINGHGDALGGAVLGSQEDIKRIRKDMLVHLGGVLSPFNAWLINRGLVTLPQRMEQYSQSALQIARYLDDHPKVSRVFYPGLESHENHDVARRQMSGFGGVLSFVLKGGFEAVRAFLSCLRYAHLAANLGAVETLVGPPATTSHVELTPEERAAAGIPEALIRYSAGIEDAEDLIADLDQALVTAVTQARLE